MPAELSDMPVDVLEKVVKISNLRDCLVLRKVSRDLQNIVDSSEIKCENIHFEFRNTYWGIESEDLRLRYVATEDGGCEVTLVIHSTFQSKSYRDDRNFKQVMLTDVSTFLKNPKLKIRYMILDMDSIEAVAEFFEFLKSLKAPINVRSIQSRDLYNLHLMVPLLKQETLEDIIFTERDFNVAKFNELAKTEALAILKNQKLKINHMDFENYSDESFAEFLKVVKTLDNPRFGSIVFWGGHEERMTPALRFLNLEQAQVIRFKYFVFTIEQFNVLAGMEQWKKRTTLTYCDFPEMGIEKLVDFKEVNRYISFNEDTEEDLIKIRDILLKSPYLQDYRLILHARHKTKKDMYKQIDAIMGQDPAYDAETHRASIPNSRDYFQLELYSNYPWRPEDNMDLIIRRKSKQ